MSRLHEPIVTVPISTTAYLFGWLLLIIVACAIWAVLIVVFAVLIVGVLIACWIDNILRKRRRRARMKV